MSAAATTPDPAPTATPAARLLNVVRKLIDYGRQLAANLRGGSVTTAITHAFGTTDVELILARIAQGLQRALLLEERVVRTAARLDAGPQPKDPSSPRLPRRPRPAVARTETAEPAIAGLPTPEQIAAKVRHQRIGVVLADICRDLGIMPNHPLWQDLHEMITRYDGNFVRLVMERLNRAFPVAHIVARLRGEPAAPPPPASTGPPAAVPAAA